MTDRQAGSEHQAVVCAAADPPAETALRIGEATMRIHVHEDQLRQQQTSRPADGPPADGLLIGPANGATGGFCMGISYYPGTEYGQPGVHDDQEGFYVLEGFGLARVGEEELEIRPGSAFIANRGVLHTMKRYEGSPPIKVLWCHGAP